MSIGEGRRRAEAMFRSSHGRRFFIFLLVGGLNTVVGYGLFAGLILLGAGKTLALVVATCLGVLFNFKSIGRLVFKDGGGRRLPRFIAIYFVQFLTNLAGLEALERIGLGPLVSQLILLPPLAVASFLMMQRFVFRPSALPDEATKHL